jgi:hypothetical protein
MSFDLTGELDLPYARFPLLRTQCGPGSWARREEGDDLHCRQRESHRRSLAGSKCEATEGGRGDQDNPQVVTAILVDVACVSTRLSDSHLRFFENC